MRLSYVLLVVATTLLASSSATTAAQPTPVKLESDDVLPSNYAETGANTGKRFLRGYETVAGEKDSIDDEEERFADVLKILGFKSDFASRYLKNMMKNKDFELKMYGRWHQNKRSVEEVTTRLNKKNPRYQKLVRGYKEYEKKGKGKVKID